MSMFHDLNLSKSLMDTVKAVREGKSEDEIKNIQKKYQTEAKKPQEKFAMVDPKGKVVATGSDERDLKMERSSVADRLGYKKDDLKVVEMPSNKKMKIGDTMKESLEEKELTQAEKDKREEIAKAIERENPDMPMDKKMAIATDRAKKATESVGEETKKNTKDDVKGGGKVETEPDEGEKKGKKEPVDINPEMTESKKTKNEEEDDPCWDGYKQVGMKKKNGEEVPNCVPKEEDNKSSYGVSLESVIKQVQKRHK